MSSPRRLHDIVVEPSAAGLFHTHAQTSGAGTISGKLPSLFTFSYNFMPDSAADSTRGALYVPNRSQSDAADFHLELNHIQHSNGGAPEVPASERRGFAHKSAHLFSGPQLPSKPLDLVLVWDSHSKVYRLDRIASSFAFKAERSRTVPSSEATKVWSEDTETLKRKRTMPAGVEAASASTPQITNAVTGNMSRVSSPSMRKRPQQSVYSTRKSLTSSNRRWANLDVEPESFADTAFPSNETNTQSCTEDPSSRAAHSGHLKSASSIDGDNATDETGETSLEQALALQLESELERELEAAFTETDNDNINSKVGSDGADQTAPSSKLRLKQFMKTVDTPRAHSPEAHDVQSAVRGLALDLSSSYSSLQNRQEGAPTARLDSATVGVGLGVFSADGGHTSPASPRSKNLIRTAHDGDDKDDEMSHEDDGLDDFAAELDMTLADEDQASDVHMDSEYTQPDVSRRVAHMSVKQRRAYGLGGPRVEEQDLEDSD